MRIVSGIDLIYLPKFKKSLQNGGENFLQRVFVSNELKNTNIEHLAGIFAAKEAVMKALNLPKDSWHEIHITYEESGAPKIILTSGSTSLDFARDRLLNSSISIAHTGQYVIAQFVALLI